MKRGHMDNLATNIRKYLSRRTPERLQDIHRQLIRPGDHHNLFLALIARGNRTSVPFLIHALEFQGNTARHEGMICTKIHCLEALAKCAGTYAGPNYSDWHAWWESVRAQAKWSHAHSEYLRILSEKRP